MRIGLDIDGVIYQWEKTARYMLREILPGQRYRDDPALRVQSPRWDYIKDVVDKEAWDWLWTHGVHLGLFRYGHLYPGAIEAIRGLNALGSVSLVTHRPASAVRDTLAWLSLLDLPIEGLHILSGGEPKSTVTPEFDYFVDDKPSNVLDLELRTKTKVALMRRPWNHDHQRGTVVQSLGHFCEEVRRDIRERIEGR